MASLDHVCRREGLWMHVTVCFGRLDLTLDECGVLALAAQWTPPSALERSKAQEAAAAHAYWKRQPVYRYIQVQVYTGAYTFLRRWQQQAGAYATS